MQYLGHLVRDIFLVFMVAFITIPVGIGYMNFAFKKKIEDRYGNDDD